MSSEGWEFDFETFLGDFGELNSRISGLDFGKVVSSILGLRDLILGRLGIRFRYFSQGIFGNSILGSWGLILGICVGLY